MTVGAMADLGKNGFYLAYFSSRGPTADGRVKPDIIAPGVRITAADASTMSGYIAYSGTSMASPFVAGVMALMLSADPSLTPAQVKSALLSTAETNWGPPGTDSDFGAGRVDAYAAIKKAGSFSGTGPAVPVHDSVVDWLDDGSYADWYVSVTDLTTPVAVTLIMPDWNVFQTIDFDLYVYDPDGWLVYAAYGTTRQETIAFRPKKKGWWLVRVLSYNGSGKYYLDTSSK